ncbi:hypothetical protein NFI95_15600 [Acetobacteraceae bacterium KSS8]|uniref:Uncharacterized protein n=1 Tax=Endosaccharibacter trunci TaxID=2812733 RepID=A0ABT1WAF5_9PROT|nr:hypothetical protein [Acetobacteraceae bacterium KSS8]
MVAQAAIQRHVAFGYAKAAAVLGAPVQQIRPTAAMLPLQQPTHATLTAFFDQDAAFGMKKPWSRRTAGGSEGFAALDTTDVLPGDILVGVDTYFVTRFEPIRPCQVILTNTLFDVLASSSVIAPDPSGYRGRTRAQDTPIATGWPGNKRAGGRSEIDPAKLPSDSKAASWTILLPPIPGVTIVRETMLRDGDGQLYQVAAANLEPFGWTLIAVEIVV